VKAERAGLYVHVPFCLTRCGYCDFNTYAGLDHLSGRYVEALVAEAGLWREEWDRGGFASLFFGGGTPTTLPVRSIGRLLAGFARMFEFEGHAEITSEANPDTIDERYLAELRLAGVNRLSLGVQSFDPAVLAALERIHSAQSARLAYAAARRAGFDDVNLDLIYGANGESLQSWRRTLAEAIDLGPDHLSAYALTIEPATSLGRQVGAGLTPAPDPDFQAEMYEAACTMLAEGGYEHYEISNWAKPGHRSVHNMGYWEGRPYLGLGAGAHSYRAGRRWWNVRPPQQYLEEVEAGRRPIGGSEGLGQGHQRMERLLLGLRVSDGVPVEWLDLARAAPLVAEGLAEWRNGHLVLTERGMFVANQIVLELAGSSAQGSALIGVHQARRAGLEDVPDADLRIEPLGPIIG
jgi:putative oxygen-independent coproporphyrinogen III oxidase